jgi:hypothetical protein
MYVFLLENNSPNFQYNDSKRTCMAVRTSQLADDCGMNDSVVRLPGSRGEPIQGLPKPQIFFKKKKLKNLNFIPIYIYIYIYIFFFFILRFPPPPKICQC